MTLRLARSVAMSRATALSRSPASVILLPKPDSDSRHTFFVSVVGRRGDTH